MTKTKRKEEYVYVGRELRDELIEDIASIDWDGDRKAQAEKIKSALQIATPQRTGYLINTDGWSWGDVDFLREALSSVRESLGHTAMSRGIGFGNTLIGRQIRALREKL
jgi:hypothetical protein